MLKYSLHNHTKLCKHAQGSSKDMIKQGINDGFELFGISDHVAYPTSATSYRMEYSEKEAYLKDLEKLQNKYSSQIMILRGFEAEYQREYLHLLKNMYKENKIDYLILGHHYHSVHHPETYYGNNLSSAHIKRYVDECIEGIESGLFLFIAHPDIFLKNQDFDEICDLESRRLIDSAKNNNVYLEYNAGGVRQALYFGLDQENYDYPNYKFWQIVKEMNAKVVVNADAHSPQQICDKAYKLALSQVEELNLNLVLDIEIESYLKKVKRVIDNSQTVDE